MRLYLPGELPPQQHSLDQIASARANGCSVGGYVWAYADFDPRQTVRDALALAAQAGVTLPVLWIDCEDVPGPGANWLRAAVAECWASGVQPGIYSGKWWLDAYLPEAAEFGNLPLWLAAYDGVPDPDVVDLPRGWKQLAGKQYAGQGLDRDVFWAETTGYG